MERARDRATARRRAAASSPQLYVGQGLDPDLAAEVARQLSRDPDDALEVHAREELGVDPRDLPSPMLAAGSSFASFAVGALVPVLPYLLGADSAAAGAVVLTLLGLFACGAVVARVTSRTWWYGGLRQLVLGGVAAAVTYGSAGWWAAASADACRSSRHWITAGSPRALAVVARTA